MDAPGLRSPDNLIFRSSDLSNRKAFLRSSKDYSPHSTTPSQFISSRTLHFPPVAIIIIIVYTAGGPVRFLGIVHPTPSWSAAVMKAHADDGGLYLFLVVPSSACDTLRSSAVLSELVPEARFA